MLLNKTVSSLQNVKLFVNTEDNGTELRLVDFTNTAHEQGLDLKEGGYSMR